MSPSEVGDERALASLLRYGGFPEQFLAQSEVETKRFAREYRARMVRDDLRDLETVKDLSSVELLVGRFPDLVGSCLSINALREDLQVAHKTVASWLMMLERLYGIFPIAPFSAPKIRAGKREQKHCMFDWTTVSSSGARFENLIAVQLLKYCFYCEDTRAEDIELRYFRDSDGREVDFVIVKDKQPQYLIECKVGDQEVAKSLLYLHNRFPKAAAYQIHLQEGADRVSKEGINVCHASRLLAQLNAD